MLSTRPASAATVGQRAVAPDVARAAALTVVVGWHWALSVTHRNADGVLVMANPIDTFDTGPGRWLITLLTWLLQVVPVFFLVGGYVHADSWLRRSSLGQPWRAVAALRARRLVVPLAVWAACWSLVEIVARLAGAPRPLVVEFPGLVTPLWFLAAYLPLVLLAPLLVTLQQRYAGRVPAVLGLLVVVGSLAERGGGVGAAAWAVTCLVWLLAFALGVAWRVHRLDARPLPARLGIAAAGLAGMALLPALGGYSPSLVSTATHESNLLPTTAMVAALAVFQLGLLLVAAPALTRRASRSRLANGAAAVSRVALTIFLWHMSAYYLVLLGVEAAGGTLSSSPDADWWAQRWLWLLAPAVVLAAAVLLRRVEARGRARRVPPG